MQKRNASDLHLVLQYYSSLMGGGRMVKPRKYLTTVEGEAKPLEYQDLAKFEPYESIEDVPVPVRQKIRELAALGEPNHAIARLIEIPEDWVETILAPGNGAPEPRKTPTTKN